MASRAALFEGNEVPFMCSSEFRGSYEAEILIPDQSNQQNQQQQQQHFSPPKQFVFPLVRIRVSSEQISIFDGPVREVFFSQWNTVTDIRHKNEPNAGTTMLMVFDEVKGLLIIRNRDPAAITALLKAIHLFASVPDKDLAARQQLGLPTTAQDGNAHHSSPGARNNTQFHPHSQHASTPQHQQQQNGGGGSPGSQLDHEHQMELERLRARTESMRRDISVGNLRSNNRRSESRATSSFYNNNNNGGGSRSESRQQPGYLNDTDSTARRRQAAAARRSTSNPRSEVSHHHLPPQYPNSQHHNQSSSAARSPQTHQHRASTPSLSHGRNRSESPMQEALSMYEEKLKKSEALAAKIQAEFQQDRLALRAATAADFSSSPSNHLPSSQQNQTDVIVDELKLWMSTLDHAADESKRSLERRGYSVREAKQPAPLVAEVNLQPQISQQQPQQLQSPPASPTPRVVVQQQQVASPTVVKSDPPPVATTNSNNNETSTKQQTTSGGTFDRPNRPTPLQISNDPASPVVNNNNKGTPENALSPMSTTLGGSGAIGIMEDASTTASPKDAGNTIQISGESRQIRNDRPPPGKKTITVAGGSSKSLAEMAAEAAAKRQKERDAKNASAEEPKPAPSTANNNADKEKEDKEKAEREKKEKEAFVKKQLEEQQKQAKVQEEKRLAEEKKVEEEHKKQAQEQENKLAEAHKQQEEQQKRQAEAYAQMQERIAAQSATAASGDGSPIKKPPPPVKNPPPPGEPLGTNHSVADGTAKPAGTVSTTVAPKLATATTTPATTTTQPTVAASSETKEQPQDPLQPLVKDNWKRFYDKEKNQFIYENIATYDRKYSPEGTSFAKLPVPELPKASASSSNDDPTQPVIKGIWQRTWAASKNKHYYINLETKAKTWKASETSFADEAAGTSSAAAPAASSSSAGKNDDLTVNLVKGVWTRIWVPDRNKCYYANTETKQKTWKVAETSFADGTDGATPLGGDNKTASSSSTSATTAAASSSSSSSNKKDEFDPKITIVKGEWKRIWNPEKSKHYYANTATKKSTYKVAETSFADGTDGATELTGASSPTAAPASPSAAASSSSSSDPTQPLVKGDWKRLWNADKNKHYYVQISTKKSTYKIAETSFADGEDGAEAASPARATQNPPASPSAAAAGNSASEDPTQAVVKGPWKRMWAADKNKHYYVNLETKERTWKAAGTTFE